MQLAFYGYLTLETYQDKFALVYNLTQLAYVQ